MRGWPIWGLSYLWDLCLADTDISDAGLDHLKRLTGLRELMLIDTQISDASLTSLKGMTSLKRLWLGGTQISSDGILELQQAIPGAIISRY